MNLGFKPIRRVRRTYNYGSISLESVEQRVKNYSDTIQFNSDGIKNEELEEKRIKFAADKADKIKLFEESLNNRAQAVINMENFLQKLGVEGIKREKKLIAEKKSTLSRNKRDFVKAFKL